MRPMPPMPAHAAHAADHAAAAAAAAAAHAAAAAYYPGCFFSMSAALALRSAPAILSAATLAACAVFCLSTCSSVSFSVIAFSASALRRRLWAWMRLAWMRLRSLAFIGSIIFGHPGCSRVLAIGLGRRRQLQKQSCLLDVFISSQHVGTEIGKGLKKPPFLSIARTWITN